MAEGDPRQKPHRFIDGIEQKHCTKCDTWKALADFGYAKDRWDKLKVSCRQCTSAMTLAWRDKNRDHTREYNRQWMKDNPDKAKASKERCKITSIDKIRAAANSANLKRRKTVQGALQHRVSNLIRVNLKRNKQGRMWSSMVDYTIEDLINHLSKTLPAGYSWDDFIGGKLHLDHIIPVTAFNFSTPDDLDFKRCWSLRNLRLLPAFDNMSKHNKLESPFQPSLALAV